jgi:4a-hydroxytetrahydrobiopterin dehydratase
LARLNSAEIQSRLADLPGWSIEDGQLIKAWHTASFAHGVLFIVAIAQLAEAANHHPDISLRGYSRVAVALATHSAGGLTGKDFDLAAAIEALPHKKPRQTG